MTGKIPHWPGGFRLLHGQDAISLSLSKVLKWTHEDLCLRGSVWANAKGDKLQTLYLPKILKHVLFWEWYFLLGHWALKELLFKQSLFGIAGLDDVETLPTERKGEGKHLMVTKNDQESKRSKKFWKKDLQVASCFLKDKLSMHSINMHWTPTMIQSMRRKDKKKKLYAVILGSSEICWGLGSVD